MLSSILLCILYIYLYEIFNIAFLMRLKLIVRPSIDNNNSNDDAATILDESF